MLPRLVFLGAAAALLLPAVAPAALAPLAVAISSARLVESARFPNANTVVLESEQRVEVNAAGGYVRRTSVRTKVLTEEGRRDSLSWSTGFNRSYGYAKVTALRIVKPDGRVVEFDPEKQSAEQQDPSSASMNIYDPNDRQLTVAIPGVEIGDIVEISAEEAETKPRMKGCFSDITPLESAVPVMQSRYTVVTPKSLPLARMLIKGGDASNVKHGRTEKADTIEYTWEVGETAQLLPEPAMPSLHLCARRLLVSTVPDWQTVSRWYWDLSEPHFAMTPEIKAKAEELVAGVTDREDRLRRIHRYVSQEIRYMGITTETEAPGYEPHDVAMTFDKRYGVCRDKAALLVVMLRAAGFDAYPVLIMAGGDHLDEEVALPYFNHAITAIRESDGTYRLMDSTDENTKDIFPAYLSNCSYLVAHPTGETLRISPIPDAALHLLTGETRISVHGDGSAAGETVMRFAGLTDTVYRGRLAQARPDDIRRFVQTRLASLVPGARVEAVEVTPAQVLDTTQPLSLRVRFTAPEYVTRRDGKAFVRTPYVAGLFGLVSNELLQTTELEKRRFPLKLSMVSGVKESVAVTLPEGFGETLALPDDVTVKNTAYAYSRQLRRDGAVLTGASDLRIHALDIPASEYPAMRAGLRDILRASRKSPLLSVADEAKPDSRVLHRKVVFRLKDAHSFDLQVEERRRILTYAGKKDNAELKLNWNTADAEPRLVRASVTDTAGKEHSVSPAEINVLDADWAAAAPRYTPTRTKVISLPSVDVGAEINLAYVISRAGLPAITWQSVFADADRVDADEVEIDAPASLALYFTNRADAGVTSQDGRIRIRVTRAVNPAPREAHSTDAAEWAPSVRISTVRDEAALARAMRPVLDAGCTPDASVRRKAAELLASAPTGELERLRVLRDFVAKSIRQAGPAWGEIAPAGFSGAARTLADGYGAAADRQMLFCALARAAGFAAQPALYATDEAAVARYQHGEPLPPGFYGTLGTRVKLRGTTVDFTYLDQYAHPQVNTTPGGRVLELDSGVASPVVAPAGMGNYTADNYRVELSDTGAADVTHTRFFHGEFATDFTRQVEEFTPEARSRYQQEAFTGLARDARPRGEFILRAGQPAKVAYGAVIPDFVVMQDKFAYFDLPQVSGQVFVGADEAARTLPYTVDGAVQRRRVWEVVLPKGWKVSGESRDLVWDGPAGSGTVALRFTSSYETDRRRRLRATFDVNLRPADISPAAYPALVELNRRLKSPDTWRVLLEKE